jgi:hypothetical protein
VVVALAVTAAVALAALGALVAERRARRRIEARAADVARELAAVREQLVVAEANVGGGAALVHALWSLDLLRIGREWAAAGGSHDDPTVAVDTAAELAMALRLTLERQREETGVPGEVIGTDLPDVPVATALAALRVAEEVLAVVSRPSEGVEVRLAGDDDAVVVTIALDATQPDVPAVVRALAAGAGATIDVAGPTVTVRLPT